LFDFEFFKEDPAPFYQFARRLYFPKGTDTKVEPSDSHRFLAYLEQQNRLLRVYTQNIDGLEHQAGVSEKHIVYAHGSLQWATCLKCKHKLNATEIEESILKGVVPRCQQPVVYKEKSKNGLGGDESTPRSSKRHRPAEKNSTIAANRSLCGGVLKPGVVFFGEPLNGNVKRTFESDRDKADALIVIGTSLSV
jgi:NAD-dependent SIR2 family protein deacetylase